MTVKTLSFQIQKVIVKAHLMFSQRVINILIHKPSAILANLYFGFPSKKLTLIGVTGTDGKTTTVNLIYHILLSAGLRVGMVSTVIAKIDDEEIDTGFHVTSPDPWMLQKLLKKMVQKNLKYVVLEVTSHGLDQYRFWGVDFDMAVLTNITHEHLDYHKTFENYQLAKLKLFLQTKVSILNKDDPSFNFLKQKINGQKNTKIITYGLKTKADFTPKKTNLKTSLPGKYNKYNSLAAFSTASQLGITSEIINQALVNFSGVKGRLEEINEGQNFKVFVDFAHTPNALKEVLTLLKKWKKSNKKLIVVYGTAGLRDKEKRPMMGEISGKLADFSIITAEDPRTEDVNEICRQIEVGIKKAKGKYKIIVDRQEAIDFAVQKLAKKDDIVVVCGKGHEQSMCFGYTEQPWSEHAAVKKALKNTETNTE